MPPQPQEGAGVNLIRLGPPTADWGQSSLKMAVRVSRNCLCGVFASSRGSRALDELWESAPQPELCPLTRNAASIST